jgi:hypothetical protein
MSLRCGIPRAVAESLEGFADLAHGRGLTVKLGAAVDERWNADKVEIAAKIVIVEDRANFAYRSNESASVILIGEQILP